MRNSANKDLSVLFHARVIWIIRSNESVKDTRNALNPESLALAALCREVFLLSQLLKMVTAHKVYCSSSVTQSIKLIYTKMMLSSASQVRMHVSAAIDLNNFWCPEDRLLIYSDMFTWQTKRCRRWKIQ